MFKNALVSVSDKSGLVDFLMPFYKQGLRIVSTGGTAKHLQENGIEVIDVSQQTQFPEVMDGRVKTLHPHVHMCLLARDSVASDMTLLKEHSLEPFDLVVGNLYPFEQALAKNLPLEEQSEFIDIGGPSFLRAAAKSFARITTVCDPSDYKWVQEKGEMTQKDRLQLASKVFAHTSKYDQLITNYLAKQADESSASDSLNVQAFLFKTLRYGENPQQKGFWFVDPADSKGLHTSEILQGKALSYNNILDLDAAVKTLRRFENSNAVVSVKHNNPCGVAVGDDLHTVMKKSIEADPKSVFGGIIAIDGNVTQEMAEYLKPKFLECIVAKDFTDDALNVLAKKKNLRLLKYPNLMSYDNTDVIKSVTGGFLKQESDPLSEPFDSFKIIGDQPNENVKQDILLAWKACAQLKSNAICVAGDGQTLGMGMGQVNRVDAVKLAIARADEFHPDIKERVLASDAFFPFPDSIEMLSEAGIQWVIQPGGSIRDDEVIERAKSLGVNLILTGVRHFLH